MYQKLALGGIGGLTPLLAVILIADARVIDQYVQAIFNPGARGSLYLVGYALKAGFLFAVGAFWAYLHKTEQNNLKIFQLGIVAPAMILGTLTAHDARNNFQDDRQHAGTSVNQFESSSSPGLLDILIPSAHAQPAASPPQSPNAGKPNNGGKCAADNCSSKWYDAVVDGFFAREPALPPSPSTAVPDSPRESISAPNCLNGAGKGCAATLASTPDWAVLKILRDSPSNRDLRVLPPADSRQIGRARSTMDVPQNEAVLGFVSATLSRDGDRGMIFGSRGIYYHTWSNGKGPSKAFIPYQDFATRQFAPSGSAEIALGNNQFFDLSRSSVDPSQLASILQNIKGSAMTPTTAAGK